MMGNVLIIGGGEVGQAIGRLLGRHRFLSVGIYDTDPGRNRLSLPLPKAARQADLIFYCAPAAYLSATLAGIPAGSAPFVSLSKGIDASGQLTSQVLEKACAAARPFALLSGPMLAGELDSDRPLAGAAVVASPSSECLIMLESLLPASLLLTASSDLPGVAVAGVLKNAYALLLGILAAAGFGHNAAGWIAGRAFQEMRLILPLFGGDPKTAEGPAGLADLIATGFSSSSANVQAGREVVAGKVPLRSEGFHSLPWLEETIELSKAPVLQAIICIVRRGQSIPETVGSLLELA